MAHRMFPRRWWPYAALFAVVVFGVVAWWALSSGAATTQPAETMERQNALRSIGQDVATSPAVQPNPPAPGAASAAPLERLTPADVLGNPDCFMRNGTGG